MNVWDELYAAAVAVQLPRTVSPFVEAGGVGTALETVDGNIYPVCV